MSRLILLSGPVAAAGAGLCIGCFIDYALSQFYWSEADSVEESFAAEGKDKNGNPPFEKNTPLILKSLRKSILLYKSSRYIRQIVVVIGISLFFFSSVPKNFIDRSEEAAHGFSNPQLLFKTRLSDGRFVTIDDYREAYFWLRDKTPKDSRVMAWWDYGYQITGIGNRTSIADGNTWNHEHIATLGKCLTSPVPEAHSLIRHLADYVLVWAGGYGDDLGKSPHMARIGNSVYHDICPKDPLCAHFGFYNGDYTKPTQSMRKSLLYNIHSHNIRPGVRVNPKYFKEAYTSKFGLVRIFKVMNVSQESKDWVADPKNRICDAPGSWYCVGQYPPAPEIKALLAKKTDFAQLEDFNKKKKNDAYHNEYMKRWQQMGG